MCVCVCVCVCLLPLSRLNRQTYRLDFRHVAQVEGYVHCSPDPNLVGLSAYHSTIEEESDYYMSSHKGQSAL